MNTLFSRSSVGISLLLKIDQRNGVVTILIFSCNRRYISGGHPVAEPVLRSSPPQGDDELKGPFQSSCRSSGKIPEGSEIAFLKGREEATVQEAKLVVPPFLESEIDNGVTVNGLASAVDALKHPIFQETQFLGS